MVKLFQVDAFTDQPFKGNPAAVCLLKNPKSDEWMQEVAAEMNLSETAFIVSQENGYSLRWFTPVAEVDLCGHATLASAHTLWENGYLNSEQEARFFTKSGRLTAKRKNDWIELNFPSELVEACPCPKELEEGLGVTLTYVGKNRMDYLVEVESEDVVRQLEPNWSYLEKVSSRGIVVTSASSTGEYDFVSRAFFPSLGIKEDPVTGSAHCGLGPYWQNKLGKDHLLGYQASNRGGLVKVTLHQDRILLAGQAVTVLSGDLID